MRLGFGFLPVGHITHTIGAETQRAGRRDFWIQLPEAAGRGIAGIDEHFVSGVRSARVEFGKPLQWHVYLSAHLDRPRRPSVHQSQWNRSQCAQVGRNVFAGFSIASGRPTDQDSFHIAEIDRQPIKLGLAAVSQPRLRAQSCAQTTVKLSQLIRAEGVVERQHGLQVLRFGKSSRRGRANPLGGRIRHHQFWVLCLKALQLPQQAVILRIRHPRLVQYVVGVVVLVELGAQRLDSGAYRL